MQLPICSPNNGNVPQVVGPGQQLDPRGILKHRGIRENTRDGKERANCDGTGLACVRVCGEKAAFNFVCYDFRPPSGEEGRIHSAAERERTYPPSFALIFPLKDQRPRLQHAALPQAPQQPRPAFLPLLLCIPLPLLPPQHLPRQEPKVSL